VSTTTQDARTACIARQPGQPGAVAYINTENANPQSLQRVLHDWLNQGYLVEKVTLDQALEELNRYSATPPRPVIEHGAIPLRMGSAEPLPIMLRKQAD
jgi:ferric-dicitrate binding protein FerR (iron transport regulator)